MTDEAAAPEKEWTILYHAMPFPGRAQPIRLMFVDSGVEWAECGEGLYGPDGYCDAFRGTGDTTEMRKVPFWFCSHVGDGVVTHVQTV